MRINLLLPRHMHLYVNAVFAACILPSKSQGTKKVQTTHRQYISILYLTQKCGKQQTQQI